MTRSALLFLFLTLIAVATASCPNKCKKGRQAKNECLYLDHCELKKCDLNPYKRGKICTDKKPVPTHCTGKCQKKKYAKKECKGKYDCKLERCPYSKTWKCSKYDPKKTETATPTPSPSPHHKCQTCPFGQFQAPGPYCRCVNKACDACPDGTICRKTESKSYRRRELDTSNTSVRDSGFIVDYDQFICVSCECGYCDAKAAACCGMVGANCKPTDSAQIDQCMYGDFDILNDGYAGEPKESNVCYPKERLGLMWAEDLVETCGCIPNAEKKCIIAGGGKHSNCRIPRL